MATLRDIKRRIKAVSNTQQITKAMKMVSASKLRKAQNRMLEMRVYADKLRAVISGLAQGAETESHPLLSVRPRQNVDVIVITSDRGLCGAFNTNVIRAATRLIAELEENEKDTVSGGQIKVRINTIGKKARDYYKRRPVEIRNTWTGFSGSLRFEDAQEVAMEVSKLYAGAETDEVYVVYNEFKNVAQQIVRTVKVLPASAGDGTQEQLSADYIYEPSMEMLLESLLPKNIEVQVYRSLLESVASEEAARMTAMENATKSASEMINTLTLQYNKARQASITAELMDIVGGVEALKQN